MASLLLHVARTYPFRFGVIFSGCKTSVSDLIVQLGIEQREQIDWRRNAAFACFGFGYLGVVQYTLYVPIFGRLFPRTADFAAKPLREKMVDFRGQAAVVAQVFLDQCVHHPFAYYPAFYLTKEIVTCPTDPDFGRALSNWRTNFWPDLYALWQIWVPATMFNFSFSPMWMRIPVVATTSLVWTMVLSAMRGAEKTKPLAGVAASSDVILEAGEVEEPILGAHVSARTMEILARGLARRGLIHHIEEEPKMVVESTSEDPEKKKLKRTLTLASDDKAHICVTATGPDRVGMVSMLTRYVFENGGNITDSKMLRMEDEMVIVMHVSCDAEISSDFRASLLNYEERPHPLDLLDVRAREVGHHTTDDRHKREARLRLTGRDQSGIVSAISAAFTSLGFNIDELATDTVPAGTKGTPPWFLLEVFATAPDDDNKHELDKKIDKLREELGVKIDLTWTR